MTDQKIQECIKWVDSKTDLSFLSSNKAKEIVRYVLEWGQLDFLRTEKLEKEQEEKKKKEEAERADYEEVI